MDNTEKNSSAQVWLRYFQEATKVQIVSIDNSRFMHTGKERNGVIAEEGEMTGFSVEVGLALVFPNGY